MYTTNYDLKDLLKNVRKYIDKYKYNIYFITEEHLLISKEKLTIAELNQKRCEINGEDYHYYW